MMRVVRHWNRFPREAVDASSLEVLKDRLDGTLSNLIKWKISLSTAGRLDQIFFEDPFQNNLLYNSMINLVTIICRVRTLHLTQTGLKYTLILKVQSRSNLNEFKHFL